MIDKMNMHYSFTNPATIHDEEALTSLELAGRQGAKINELVTAYNELEADTNEHLDAQDETIEARMDAQDKAIPVEVTQEVQKRINDGSFDRSIDQYAGNLEARVDNLLGTVSEGSTTMDAEVIDARTGHDGTAYDNMGQAVRYQIANTIEQTKGETSFNRPNLIKTMTWGKYVNMSGGVPTIFENELYGMSNPIFLEKGAEVWSSYYTGMGNNRNAYLYDPITNGYISRTENINGTEDYNKFVIQETGMWVFCFHKKARQFVTINGDDLDLGVFGCYLPDDLIVDKVKNTLVRKNLITKLTEGYAVSGAIVDYAGLCRTQPIYLEKGSVVYSTYHKSYGENRLAIVCDANGTPLTPTVANEQTDTKYNKFTIPMTAHYLFNMGTSGCVCYDPADLTAPMGTYLPDDFIGETISSLKGKSISFNGDSICAGAGSSGGYGKIIADTYNMVYENIAVGGATITAEQYRADNGNARHWVSRTIANMNADADYFIVEGGVNDASLGVPLGALTSGYTETLDDTTFYGAFESMCKQLVTTFAGKKVGYIFVHKMTSGFDSRYDNNYYTAAKECCEKWGVPYLDLNTECPPLKHIPALAEAYTSEADGWHPNEAGYKAYYVPKITAWLESL